MSIPTLPTLTLQAAFDTKPTEAPTWTDISSYLRLQEGMRCNRGRMSELDSAQPGSATVYLDNRTRIFDPNHATGTYYGKLLPMKRVRLLATWAGVQYPVFTMYAQRWPQTWPARGDAVVPLPCIDGLAVLGAKQITDTYSQERSDVRIGRLLSAVNWTTGESWVLGSAINGALGTTTKLGPNGDRLLTEGNSNVQASTLDKTNALSHAQDVERTEQGLFFVNASGVMVFHSRHRALDVPYRTSQGTFGDAAGELPYPEMVLADDDQWLYNEVVVSRTGGTDQTATDSASGLDYFTRTLSPSATLHTTDTEALAMAEWLLSKYKGPHQRAQTIVILPQRDPDNLWPQVLGRELGDRITVVRRPPGGGTAITIECLIQAIEHQLSNNVWRTVWQLAPAAPDNYWILGTSSLAADTRLCW